ncbi:hypothetical protein NDU88_005329 [Pleurodeles waltl]|uniref:Uncharacterized protein n=1 Tax=Pleurodeles waltl TaxID=8319 RepID=A0AAV7PF79_PLEWA|nr:hypothetical protein NDU88_005329 [Pleurodeles waltl]
MGRTKTKSGSPGPQAHSCPSPLESSLARTPENCIPTMDQRPQAGKLDLILQIRESSLVIEHRLGVITTVISIFKDEHRKLAEKVKTNEAVIDVLLPAKLEHTKQMNKLTRVEILQKRAKDAEATIIGITSE